MLPYKCLMVAVGILFLSPSRPCSQPAVHHAQHHLFLSPNGLLLTILPAKNSGKLDDACLLCCNVLWFGVALALEFPFYVILKLSVTLFLNFYILFPFLLCLCIYLCKIISDLHPSCSLSLIELFEAPLLILF